MPKYMVIGYYAEDNQTSADSAEAEDGAAAMRIVARERLGERDAAGDYENQGEFQLVCAVLQGSVEGEDAKPGDRFTWPGDGMVEARDFFEEGWDLEDVGEDLGVDNG